MSRESVQGKFTQESVQGKCPGKAYKVSVPFCSGKPERFRKIWVIQSALKCIPEATWVIKAPDRVCLVCVAESGVCAGSSPADWVEQTTQVQGCLGNWVIG